MTFPHSAQPVRQSADRIDQPVEVVFIGDDPQLADMYRLKLQLDGYAVTLVTIEQVRSDPLRVRTPDIVYLDIGLNPAGLAIHRMLRAQADTKEVPVVLLSTRLARESLPAGLKLGLHDFFISSDTVRREGFWSGEPAAAHAWH